MSSIAHQVQNCNVSLDGFKWQVDQCLNKWICLESSVEDIQLAKELGRKLKVAQSHGSDFLLALMNRFNELDLIDKDFYQKTGCWTAFVEGWFEVVEEDLLNE